MSDKKLEEREFLLEWKDKNRESDYRGKETITGIAKLHARMDELIATYQGCSSTYGNAEATTCDS